MICSKALCLNVNYRTNLNLPQEINWRKMEG
jgi:hypothetical protein